MGRVLVHRTSPSHPVTSHSKSLTNHPGTQSFFPSRRNKINNTTRLPYVRRLACAGHMHKTSFPVACSALCKSHVEGQAVSRGSTPDARSYGTRPRGTDSARQTYSLVFFTLLPCNKYQKSKTTFKSSLNSHVYWHTMYTKYRVRPV